MTTINLKDFYPWYTQDEYTEVSDEVAEELRANKRYEAAYRRRVTRTRRNTLWTVTMGSNIPPVSLSHPRRNWRCGRSS